MEAKRIKINKNGRQEEKELNIDGSQHGTMENTIIEREIENIRNVSKKRNI